jgi:1-acyl-sn-glycerol-3-phosphate acyltransferase
MTTLRSVLFNLGFFASGLILTLYASIARLFDPGCVLPVARLWARSVLWQLRVLCGIRLVVRGREHLPDGAALIASVHQSAFDTLVWLTLVPNACYVLKQELLRIPLFGRLLQDAGMIAVDRTGGQAALRGLLRDGERAVRAQRQIVIFPEGTRSAPGTLLPLQPGVVALAARTGLPIIPVTTDSGLSWSRRAFHKRAGVISIVIHPPLPVGLPRERLMARLQEVLSQPVRAVHGAGDNSVG